MAGEKTGKHVSIQDKKRPDGLPSSPAEEAKDVERQSPRVVSARNVEGGGGDDYKPVTPPSSTSSKSSIMQSQGVTIHFHQLELTAQTLSRRTFKPKIKRILKGVSGIARQGTVTALMGPSGCGKTSLLHTLAGKNSSSKVCCGMEDWKEGSMSLGGNARCTLIGRWPDTKPTGPSQIMYKRVCGRPCSY